MLIENRKGTVFERIAVVPAVAIDGKEYEFRSPKEMSLAEQAELTKRLNLISNALEDPKAAEKALAEAIERIVIGLEPEKMKALRDSQKVELVKAFNRAATNGSQVPPVMPEKGPSPQDPSTSAA